MQLPLHKDVVWPCRCCGIPHDFIFRSQSDQVVCGRCLQHGQDLNARNALHIHWWSEYVDQLRTAHGADATAWHGASLQLEQKLAERDQRIADMKAVALRGYESTPLGGIKKWLQEGVVIEAENKMRGAYRSRDRVMGTIWRIDQLHQEGSRPGQCRCGKRVDSCKELAALAPVIKVLDAWETKQIEFLDRGMEHYLPAEHPEVRKRRARGGWVA